MASPLTASHWPICLRRSSNIGAIRPSCVGPTFISRFPPKDTVSTRVWGTGIQSASHYCTSILTGCLWGTQKKPLIRRSVSVSPMLSITEISILRQQVAHKPHKHIPTSFKHVLQLLSQGNRKKPCKAIERAAAFVSCRRRNTSEHQSSNIKIH